MGKCQIDSTQLYCKKCYLYNSPRLYVSKVAGFCHFVRFLSKGTFSTYGFLEVTKVSREIPRMLHSTFSKGPLGGLLNRFIDQN